MRICAPESIRASVTTANKEAADQRSIDMVVSKRLLCWSAPAVEAAISFTSQGCISSIASIRIDIRN